MERHSKKRRLHDGFEPALADSSSSHALLDAAFALPPVLCRLRQFLWQEDVVNLMLVSKSWRATWQPYLKTSIVIHQHYDESAILRDIVAQGNTAMREVKYQGPIAIDTVPIALTHLPALRRCFVQDDGSSRLESFRAPQCHPEGETLVHLVHDHPRLKRLELAVLFDDHLSTNLAAINRLCQLHTLEVWAMDRRVIVSLLVLLKSTTTLSKLSLRAPSAQKYILSPTAFPTKLWKKQGGEIPSELAMLDKDSTSLSWVNTTVRELDLELICLANKGAPFFNRKKTSKIPPDVRVFLERLANLRKATFRFHGSSIKPEEWRQVCSSTSLSQLEDVCLKDGRDFVDPTLQACAGKLRSLKVAQYGYYHNEQQEPIILSNLHELYLPDGNLNEHHVVTMARSSMRFTLQYIHFSHGTATTNGLLALVEHCEQLRGLEATVVNHTDTMPLFRMNKPWACARTLEILGFQLRGAVFFFYTPIEKQDIDDIRLCLHTFQALKVLRLINYLPTLDFLEDWTEQDSVKNDNSQGGGGGGLLERLDLLQVELMLVDCRHETMMEWSLAMNGWIPVLNGRRPHFVQTWMDHQSPRQGCNMYVTYPHKHSQKLVLSTKLTATNRYKAREFNQDYQHLGWVFQIQ